MSVVSIFARLPDVPDDRAERAALLDRQRASLAVTVAVAPIVGRFAAAAERGEPLDRYADSIARAYGKLDTSGFGVE